MKKTLIILAFLISTSVLAESKGKEYLGMQYGLALYTDENSPDFNPTFGAIRAGYQVSKRIALELRYGKGNRNDTEGPPTWISVDIDEFSGIYALGSLSLTKSIHAYILAGYTSMELIYNGPAAPVKERGFSYGIGFNFRGYRQDISWNLEYVNYIYDPDEPIDQKSLSSVNIGATVHF